MARPIVGTCRMSWIGRATRLVVVIILLVAGVWLMLPGRNLYGNPWFEILIGECRLADGSTIRFYEGNGGATTAFWQTVTHFRFPSMRERQIVFAYASPTIVAATCQSDDVNVVFDDGIARRKLLFEQAHILEKLRERPFAFHSGRNLEPPWLGPVRLSSAVLGALMLSMAGHLAGAALRR